MNEDLRDILEGEEFERLRRDNPRQLYRYLMDMKQRFLFGVEDARPSDDADEYKPIWGGVFKVLLNRNVILHLCPCFNEEMPGPEDLPQWSVFPDEMRAGSTEDTETVLPDGERIPGVCFFVDPDEFDVLIREAAQVAEAFPTWDAIPDSYYLDTDLVRFLTREVLEHPALERESKFDFRLGFVGGAPTPLDEEIYPIEDLVGTNKDAEAQEDEEAFPTHGMRTHRVEWGGDAESPEDWEGV